MSPDTSVTRPLRSCDQLEAWREWYSPVLDVLPKHSTSDEFTAEMHLWELGGLAMSRTIAPPIHVVRAKSNLRRDPVDHWVISYCARGAHFAQTAGTETEVPAKVPFDGLASPAKRRSRAPSAGVDFGELLRGF